MEREEREGTGGGRKREEGESIRREGWREREGKDHEGGGKGEKGG